MATPSQSAPEDWWYAAEAGGLKGPLSTPSLAQLFASGEIDGLTKVSNDESIPTSEWLSLSEYPSLRDAARSYLNENAEASSEAEKQDASSAAEKVTQQSNPLSDSAPLNFGAEAAQPPGHSLPGTDKGGVPTAEPARSGPPDATRAEAREKKRQSRKRAREAKRQRERLNTSIYITGIPSFATEQDLAAHFAKCGIILPSTETGRPRVKLYRDERGAPKGDALVTYAMEPSVENALELLDGVPLEERGPGLKVQRASFEHKKVEGGDETKRRREAEDRKKRAGPRSRDLVREALSWAESGQEGGKGGRIVILKNVFDAADADYRIVREDMEEGCRACGEVERITVFEKNAEGAVAVKFASWEACLKCVEIMNDRWYDGRKLTAEFYDGQTDYRYKETEEDRIAREQKWQEWLETEQEETDVQRVTLATEDGES